MGSIEKRKGQETGTKRARSTQRRKGRGAPGRVFIFGAGKVGRNLATALRERGFSVEIRPARDGLPEQPIDADVVIIAVRDGDVPKVAGELSERKLVGHRAVSIVHCAGALGPEALTQARTGKARVAQMHPMISFASTEFLPALDQGQLHVDGDAGAVRAISALGRKLKMSPRTIEGLDRVAYHAAAGLVANGAAALAAGGVELLERAGVDRTTASKMLGPLLRSVADNVEQLGLPLALTGPVRRGDARGVERHLATIGRLAPHLAAFYTAAAAAQLPLARELGEAKKENFDAIALVLEEQRRRDVQSESAT